MADSLNSLGAIRLAQGAHADAESLLRKALDIRRKQLGPQSVKVAETLVALGALKYEMGDLAASEARFREAVAIHRKALGSDDLALATSLNDLAITLGQRGEV